jgi:hypothetical protein
LGGISETNRIHLVLFGMQNRISGPHLAAINRILISLVREGGHIIETNRIRIPSLWAYIIGQMLFLFGSHA